VWIISSLTTIQTPTVIALGNFDGVHRGHCKVIQPILPTGVLSPVGESLPPLQTLQFLSAGAVGTANEPMNGAVHQSCYYETAIVPYSTVVTFSPHPQEFFTGQRRELLTPLHEKAAYLKAMGVQQLVLLPFDQDLAKLSPHKFVEDILIQKLQAQQISVGQDFRFGRQRGGTTADLQAIAASHGITVQIVPLYTDGGERISSSAIRQALQQGDVSRANQLLGRPYTLMGEVVRGQQLGRTIGFPTANLKLPPEKFLPRQGVYAVWGYCSTGKAEKSIIPAVMNIGYRPTVDGVRQTIEVHLLDWSGDLYGQLLNVSLEQFLRPEQKFASLNELKSQIQSDCETARSLLAASYSRTNPG
jgi:riboflavin kinase / FMN adenylyltransferase